MEVARWLFGTRRVYKMAGQRSEEDEVEGERKKRKLRWPKNIICDFPLAVRKFCVNNPAIPVDSVGYTLACTRQRFDV
jgi:hypothetical protein